MNFREWLSTKKVTDNPRGDFIKDSRLDKNFPVLSSAVEYIGYLHSKGACREAIATFNQLWKSYEKEVCGHERK